MYNNKFISHQHDNYELERAYLKWYCFLKPFPYFWTEKYKSINVECAFDDKKNLPYVIHSGKRLYFAKTNYRLFTKKINILFAKQTYKNLCIESDVNSPHRYTTETFNVGTGDVLFDVGAAEAWFTLDNIEKISHAYIFEADIKWLAALEATFEPYKHKVTIINKFAADRDGDNFVRLDSVFKESGCSVFIKLDVEGAESDVIKGIGYLTENNNVKLAICTYHKEHDSERFKQYFEEKDYKTQLSNGYMLFPMPNWSNEQSFGKPSFRKGILRVWKRAQFPSVEAEKNFLKQEEALCRKLVLASDGMLDKTLRCLNKLVFNKPVLRRTIWLSVANRFLKK